MCLVAVKQPYVLQIMYDDDAQSPRDDYLYGDYDNDLEEMEAME